MCVRVCVYIYEKRNLIKRFIKFTSTSLLYLFSRVSKPHCLENLQAHLIFRRLTSVDRLH